MSGAHTAAVVVGALVLALDATGVVAVLIVPRPAGRLAGAPIRSVRAVFRRLAALPRQFPTQDRILAVSEPVALVLQLVVWLVVALVGFTLVNWGVNGTSLTGAFTEAGSSIFTLGFALSHTTGSRVVDFVAAGTGLVLVALQIAYLPTIYGAYNRRETLVTLLESRAGAPAWGPELLYRHQQVGLVANLPTLYADWEQWAADVAESHTSYPSLLYLRSPRALNSWIVSLIAVMDAAAMHLALDPEGAPIEARMCVRMGFTCLRDIATVLRIPFDPDPRPGDPVTLPRESFLEACERLVASGFPTSRRPEEAWPHVKGWRVNYEDVAYRVADRVAAPPARWSGPRRLFSPESLVVRSPVDRRPDDPAPGAGSSAGPVSPEPGGSSGR